MRISVSLTEFEPGEFAEHFLPGGVEIRALELDGQSFRLEASVPLAGSFAVLADARFEGASLTLSRFRVEGGILARTFLGSKLASKIGRLDWRRGALRIWGEPDGDRLHVDWSGSGA